MIFIPEATTAALPADNLGMILDSACFFSIILCPKSPIIGPALTRIEKPNSSRSLRPAIFDPPLSSRHLHPVSFIPPPSSKRLRPATFNPLPPSATTWKVQLQDGTEELKLCELCTETLGVVQ